MEDGQKRKKAEYRSSLRSKMLIRNALVTLMQQKPFEKITITDIVKEADINRGTFYAHYHDTAEVLDKIREEVVQDVLAAAKLMTPDEIIQDPSELFSNLGELMEKNREYYRTLLSIGCSIEILASAKSAVIEYISTAKAVSEYPDQAYIRCALDALAAAVTEAYLDAIIGKVDMSIKQVTQLVSRITYKLMHS